MVEVPVSKDRPARHFVREELQVSAGDLGAAVESGRLQVATFCVRRAGEMLHQDSFGKASSIDTRFLVASITKPMTAAAVMILKDLGELRLRDPVSRFIPEFSRGRRSQITVRHLLTHTSGLPDQLPDSVPLRQRQAPLAEFVRKTITTPLLFQPGTRCKYQSMGFLLAAEIVERITGRPLRDFLRAEIFEPLGMTRTALGIGGSDVSATAQCQIENSSGVYGGGEGTDSWNWNSLYWRDLGAPWGGAHSTAVDLARFLEYFLHPDGSWLKTASAKAMIADQNGGLNRPWGLGFSVNPRHFGHSYSPRVFGHWGATGTLAWADPTSDSVCIVLTTLPWEFSKDLLKQVSARTAQVSSRC